MPNPEEGLPSRSAVLLVEDDSALSGYLASALKSEGFEVQVAANRALALSCMERGSAPALVILDLGLPPAPSTLREGLLALQELLRLQAATKVIVLTGQDEAVAAHEAVRLGAFDFLTKPVSFQALVQALRRADLFAREEARMVLSGEARLNIVARIGEGPKEAGSQAEEQLLRRSFATCGYNVAETARQLGLAREHVYYYLNKYGIRRPD